MEERATRDLTSLEYVVLGLIAYEPQSGYSIVTYFEDRDSSWSASPGSIYPMLKRLEKLGVIEGELEIEHETRPRKIYRLTPLGEKMLDEWLKIVPSVRPFYEQRELAMWRFQMMEKRFTIEETLRWLRDYRDQITYADAVHQVYDAGIKAAYDEIGGFSIFRQLAMEAYVMEMNAIRMWVDMAIMRLEMHGRRTGEYPAVNTPETLK
ncbi:MAG: PadR family transcriptional regulator [bacterium]|nr:PadR family transcriptional regulator [bacterium]